MLPYYKKDANFAWLRPLPIIRVIVFVIYKNKQTQCFLKFGTKTKKMQLWLGLTSLFTNDPTTIV